MSAIEQPAARFGRITACSGRREQVGGLGHEVHAAEHDRLGVGPAERGVRELERVAHEVGVLDDLVALVEVTEHDDAVAERGLRGADARVQLVVRRGAVRLGERALARRTGGDHVAHRRARTVSGGARVELPRPLREVGRARLARLRARGEELDGAVDGCRGSGLLDRGVHDAGLSLMNGSRVWAVVAAVS